MSLRPCNATGTSTLGARNHLAVHEPDAAARHRLQSDAGTAVLAYASHLPKQRLANGFTMKNKMWLICLLVSGSAFAQGVAPATTREINQLFAALKSSNCEFSRNGSWYSAPKASEHLQRKYDYLQKKGLVTSTESFIELAATKSSMSGKPYEVRCGGAAAVPSQSWFTGKLRALRKGTPASGS
ncbi:hypothetical protein GGR70_003364 [Xanthomonas campestris]|nr:hypothetical protein [Xanthomonas campestris]